MEVTLKVSPSGSESLPKTLMVTGVLNSVVLLSFLAIGAVLGLGATLTVTRAVSCPPLSSLMW